MKFRYKFPPIEAIQWTGENEIEMMNFLGLEAPNVLVTNPSKKELYFYIEDKRFVIRDGEWLVINKYKIPLIFSDKEFHRFYEKVE